MIITPSIKSLVNLAIMEDYSMGDATTEALISDNLIGKATIISDEIGILAGIDVTKYVFNSVDPLLKITQLSNDSDNLNMNQEIAQIEGKLASILIAERTALNFLRKLSGISTETSKYVKAISHTKAKIVDTRKTTPGFRSLEKYAVRMGGGYNHRQNLADGILIKDNHIKTLAADGLTIGDVIKKAHDRASHTIKVEIEVENLDQLNAVIESGAEIILLDNMSPDDMTIAVALCKGKIITEASGGININTVQKVAESGVDLISVGAITHSAPNLDLSLNIA
jgi:nicotinate-nucleotide pyrophosphorylase (carboxylating)